MKKFLTKYNHVRRTICAFLMLYMVHAFSITALIAAPSAPSLTDITTVSHTAKDGQHKTIPNKNKNKPYSLFIAKHSQVKSCRVYEEQTPLLSEMGIVSLPVIHLNTYCNSNPYTFKLSDDSYKRYALISTYLI